MKRRAKGTGSIEKTRDGRYRPRYVASDGVRRSFESYATYQEAERTLDSVRGELVGVQLANPGGATLAGYAPIIFDRRELEGFRAVRTDRQRFKSYVAPWPCSGWPLRSIGRGEVKRLLGGLSQRGLSASTRRNTLQVLRTVFAAAVDEEIVEANPCADIKVRDHGSTEESSTALTADERMALLWSVDEDARPMVVIAAVLGLRQGEQRALRLEDVLLNDARGPHLVLRYGAPGKPTKGGKVRRVPLSGLPLAAMTWWLERGLPAYADENERGLVFPTARGCVRPKGRIVLRADWKRWLRVAGIKRRVRWHDLRHTAATLMLEEGLSLEYVKAFLGHSSVRVTERYARTDVLTGISPHTPASPIAGLPVGLVSSRRGSDSNRRMTVLQFRGKSGHFATLHEPAGLGLDEESERLAVEYLRSVAAGDGLHVPLGLRLAETTLARRDARSVPASEVGGG